MFSGLRSKTCLHLLEDHVAKVCIQNLVFCTYSFGTFAACSWKISSFIDFLRKTPLSPDRLAGRGDGGQGGFSENFKWRPVLTTLCSQWGRLSADHSCQCRRIFPPIFPPGCWGVITLTRGLLPDPLDRCELRGSTPAPEKQHREEECEVEEECHQTNDYLFEKERKLLLWKFAALLDVGRPHAFPSVLGYLHLSLQKMWYSSAACQVQWHDKRPHE